MRFRRPLAAFLAVIVALSAIGGGVFLVDQHTNRDISPVGQADASVTAAVVAGVVIVGSAYAACDMAGYCDTPNSEELKQVDALETKASIHGHVSTQSQKNDELLVGYHNYIEDTKPVATIKGKNAMIRAYDNGTTTSLARQRAYQAVEDYYAARQMNILHSWETSIATLESAHNVAENTSGMNRTWPVEYQLNADGTNSGQTINKTEHWNYTAEMQLANGTNVSYQTFYINANVSLSLDNMAGKDNVKLVYTPLSHSSDRWLMNAQYDNYAHLDIVNGNLTTPAPSSDFQDITALSNQKWGRQWRAIENKTAEVKTRMSNFYNGTHSSFQQGDINTSDLIDPYMAANEYSPQGNWGTFTLRTLMAAGHGAPADLSNVGSMNISAGNQTYSGLLLSDGLPQNDSFEVGTVYNASNLTGSQMVMSPDSQEIYDLTGEFTVTNITSSDGSSKTNVTYRTNDYQTSDVSSYKQQLDNLEKQLAEINARQQELRNAGGIGMPSLPGLGGTQSLIVVFVALLALGIVTRN